MKKLEEMDLVDDFLAYSLAVHKKYGEEAIRYILGCILGRRIRRITVVPQKAWYGEQPGEELQQLARYMEHSTVENAKSAELARLHRMVAEVKADREVGLAYMKMYEIDRHVQEKAKAEGMIENILDFLEDLGTVPEGLKEYLWGQSDLVLLRKWLKLAAHSKSIEEFEASL